MLRSSFLFLFLLSAFIGDAQVRVLFDATKAEMAGNADWVIDADTIDIRFNPDAYVSSSGHQSNPQRYPNPAQSTVTSATAETYWRGALSSWGIDCVKRGYEVETLPYNGSITYGSGSNPQDLSNYTVFVIDEPNIKFTSAEKTALLEFVQNGGGLFMISDHNGSDRNGDGWDSPNIWNDFMTNNSIMADPFGISFDLLDFSETSSNVIAAASDSIIHGPMGTVGSVKWSDGTTMTLNTADNTTVKGVIYKTGSSAGSTNVMAAYARYGSGKVAAIGDSSPTDDGTGNPSCSLYSSYAGEVSGSHRKLLMNATIWLATRDTTTAVGQVVKSGVAANIFVYPNPAMSGWSYLHTDHDLHNVSVSVSDVSGKVVLRKDCRFIGKGTETEISMPRGFYFVTVESDEVKQTTRLAVY